MVLINTIIAILTFANNASVIEAITLWLVIISLTIITIFKIPKWRQKKKNLLNPHIDCKHYASLKEMVKREAKEANDKATKNLNKIIQIKYFELIPEQMVAAKVEWIKISDILKDKFNKLLVKHKVKGVEKVNAICHYRVIIDKTEMEVMELVEVWMMENHLAIKTGAVFQQYIQNKTNLLIKFISDEIERYYLQTIFIVDHKALHDSAMECMKEISNLVIHFFSTAREISIEKNAQIEGIEKE